MELPDHNFKIRQLMSETGVPRGVMSDEDIAFSAGLLDEAYKIHGDPASPHYKEYHNTEHDFYVLRRAWDVWGALRNRMPDKFDTNGFKLLLFSVCGHDLFLGNEAKEGSDERRSGKFTMRRMLAAGYAPEEGQRVREAIDTTAVKRDEKGRITQYNIRQGSKDPLKFVLAYADINGVPMEGIPTMIRDALNLYMESSGTSLKELSHNPKKALGLMLTQADFVQDRLDDMDGDIAHYFDGKEREMVKEVLDEKYSRTSREALVLARRMKDLPDLAETAIKATLGVTKNKSNISYLPKKIGSIFSRTESDNK